MHESGRKLKRRPRRRSGPRDASGPSAAAMGAVGAGLVDCHCHVSTLEFDQDLDDVLEKAKKANVMALVAVAEHSGEFEKIMQLSERIWISLCPLLSIIRISCWQFKRLG
ncbi:putative deoxyribonuclease TATDN3 isoform X10 [Tamandua tetradactyla]|uniref:putative deoxyribonuclease TATDN3 isoform X10 n=1 Tax=Tamandua tetradactyla TaxID=48850 RepID=UPI0040545650